MDNSHDIIAVIGAAFAGVTSLVTLVFTLIERQRSQIRTLEAETHRLQLAADLEIAKLAAATAASKAEELKHTVLLSKASREVQLSAIEAKLAKKIDENTTMNEQALNVANGVNAKIVSLGLSLQEEAVKSAKTESQPTQIA